jgi:glycosyltransferase involved in cell wall biosynthesis
MVGKVVHLINDLNANGGAERIVSELSFFCENYHSTIVVWRGSNVELSNGTLPGSLKIIHVRPYKPQSVISAWRAMREADLVHVHLFPSLYLGAMLPFRKIYTEHNVWNRRRRYSWLRFFERGIYARYDCLAAVSHPVKERLSEWLYPYRADIHVVENGVDLARFHASLPRQRRPQARFRIGMIGSFSDKKDQDTLVRALARLPGHFELHFAGTGERTHAVRSLTEKLGVGGRVHFAGLVRDIPAFLDRLDLYVQSSHWEGFGLAAVEAMASRLPVLASDVAGLADVVDRDEYRFPPGDDKRLAEMIGGIASDGDKFHRAADYARYRSQYFSIERTAHAYENLYSMANLPA